jgi:hypothetical protein
MGLFICTTPLLYYIITLDDLPVHVSTRIGHLQVTVNRNEDFGVFMVLNMMNVGHVMCVYEQLSCKYNKNPKSTLRLGITYMPKHVALGNNLFL